MNDLGTLEELPVEYLAALTDKNLVPLWPSLRDLLPHNMPSRRTRPTLWRYKDVRPRLMEAGELTPIARAERRVLVLANPGLELESLRATPTIYVGMQLILPGENAPSHRHTPSAVRFAVEGQGAYTLVNGRRCEMEKGDLILTPSGLWHEHGHDGDDPVVWLDALDLPLIYSMEASYAVADSSRNIEQELTAQKENYRCGGLVPYEALDRTRQRYPLLRYPWSEVKQSLVDAARARPMGKPAQLAYVNPETGEECLPTLGFSAMMLRPGEEVRPVRRSASAVMHVVEGLGESVVDGVCMEWQEADSFAIPSHADIQLRNLSTIHAAFLFIIDDAPLQRKLGIYETIMDAEEL